MNRLLMIGHGDVYHRTAALLPEGVEAGGILPSRLVYLGTSGVYGHPCELPDIIAVPVEHGLPACFDRVAHETRS